MGTLTASPLAKLTTPQHPVAAGIGGCRADCRVPAPWAAQPRLYSFSTAYLTMFPTNRVFARLDTTQASLITVQASPCSARFAEPKFVRCDDANGFQLLALLLPTCPQLSETCGATSPWCARTCELPDTDGSCGAKASLPIDSRAWVGSVIWLLVWGKWYRCSLARC